jgi:hypothetical protein
METKILITIANVAIYTISTIICIWYIIPDRPKHNISISNIVEYLFVLLGSFIPGLNVITAIAIIIDKIEQGELPSLGAWLAKPRFNKN